jgi:hypothetical protein
MITLKVNDVVIIENKVYRILKSPYHKNKSDNERGLRVIIRLLKQKELNELILLKQKEVTNLGEDKK